LNIPNQNKKTKIMATMKMAVPHRLSQDEALNRVKKLLGQVRNQFADKISDLNENWNGNVGTFSFKAMKFAVSGTLTVTPSEVQLDGTLPWAANLFKGTIEKTIKDRAKELLA